MKKMKIYLDTSVISHLQQNDVPDKVRDTREFWNDLKSGKYEVCISDLTLDELSQCREEKRLIMAEYLRKIDFTVLTRNENVLFLAQEYINEQILTPKSMDDCIHLAFASISECDIIVSWNFKHMVKYKTIAGVRKVNYINGYMKNIDIIQPSLLIERECGNYE